MPLCFQDINEAKLYWELIMRRIPQELISESQIFLSEITRFERAFSSLYTHVQASGNTIDYICAACLRMHYLATKIMVAGTVFTSEMEYDVFLPEDRRVRREVCGVLFSNPNREGPWDRTMMAQAGKWIMEIEERGLDGEAPIPEENRVRLSRVMIDMERRRMVLQCVRRSGLDGGVLEWEEGVVELE
ncbi:hypothetical protein M7I_7324 [Glarea lozoyensis 74030]|uniref:Uncharacterized protein n=1 Tax=Glarea lozoyensis (strain ATCC 74030 / MF5533) TaxID=1104152 RepID=H0EWZ9_GLAL7|nr:hypothetical protein M7I_7324 [Glarea lozoyensis 74030]